jgi:hypothetical protein
MLGWLWMVPVVLVLAVTGAMAIAVLVLCLVLIVPFVAFSGVVVSMLYLIKIIVGESTPVERVTTQTIDYDETPQNVSMYASKDDARPRPRKVD